jgi:hypothetical protein
METRKVPIRFEYEMMDALIASIPLAFEVSEGQRTRVLKEPAIGSVIPDVLIGSWRGDLPPWGNLNAVSRHVLACLSAQKIVPNEGYLCESLLLSSAAADTAVSALKRIGAVVKRDSGEVAIQPEFDVLDSITLIAIEMKLKRWREALDQAVAYRKFADEAHVVLDGNQVRLTDEVRNTFASLGIGLFLQFGRMVTRVLGASAETPTASGDRLFALSKLAKSGPYCLA